MDDRGQPTAEEKADPPPAPGGGLTSIVQRIDQVREDLLEFEFSTEWAKFEELRIQLDRELRTIALELVARCVPDASA
jgi:hypothetical protein